MPDALARATTHPRPFTIKALWMSFSELLAEMGHSREDYAKYLSAEDAEQDRQSNIQACWSILRDSNESQVRADALDILKAMGAIQ